MDAIENKNQSIKITLYILSIFLYFLLYQLLCGARFQWCTFFSFDYGFFLKIILLNFSRCRDLFQLP